MEKPSEGKAGFGEPVPQSKLRLPLVSVAAGGGAQAHVGIIVCAQSHARSKRGCGYLARKPALTGGVDRGNHVEADALRRQRAVEVVGGADIGSHRHIGSAGVGAAPYVVAVSRSQSSTASAGCGRDHGNLDLVMGSAFPYWLSPSRLGAKIRNFSFQHFSVWSLSFPRGSNPV